MPRPRKRAATLLAGAGVLFFLGTNVQAGWLFVLAAFLAGTAVSGMLLPGRMLRGLPVTIYGTGEQERDFVYVGDVARATLAALKRGSRRVINLGSGTGTSIQAIHNTLAQIIGGTGTLAYQPPRLGEVCRIYLTAERAAADLGWHPKTDLRAGLEATVAWLRQQAPTTQALGRPIAAD